MADGRLLVLLIAGRRAGSVTMDGSGRFALTYDEGWRTARNAVPLSLSMPLAKGTHNDAPVRAFLWGLLPDNEQVLERWGRTYHVSARNPFALLGTLIGEDCAGAVQFALPERLDAVLDGQGGVNWLTEGEVAERLRILRQDPAAWHVHDSGQFSLAGAQAKTALYFDHSTNRWGEPWGSVPTTHILKPAVTGLDEHDLNEHLCLRAATLLGLRAAASRIASFGGERVIVVDRYDRRLTGNGDTARIHQEDMCQALGVLPTSKYQNDGGPGPEQVIALLRGNVIPPSAATENVGRFADALAFNWLIGGTDAHAKNYSVLMAGAQVRLAPLYDIASALAYDGMYVPKLKLAMRIGGEYRLGAIGGRHWRRFADANGISADALIARIVDLAERVPVAFAAAADADEVRELGSPLPSRLVERITARAAECRDALQR